MCGRRPTALFIWHFRLKVRTAASQAANGIAKFSSVTKGQSPSVLEYFKHLMPELLTGAPGKKKRAELSPTQEQGRLRYAGVLELA